MSTAALQALITALQSDPSQGGGGSVGQQPLNYGLAVEDGTGDPLRTAFAKIQNNTANLDARLLSNTSILAQLGNAARLNVGITTGTVADGGALAAETTRATTAEQANATAIANETSRAQAAELLKAPIASPALTGTPTAPTASNGTNSNQIATCAFVLSNGGTGGGGGTGGVPPTRQINTTGLLSGGGDLTTDRTFAVPAASQSDVATGTDQTKALTSFSVAAALGAKAPLASPAFVGFPTAPTAPAGTSSTVLATTGFVSATLGSYAPLVSPALTGSPTAPTQGAGDNSTRLSTTAYSDRAVANFAANFVASLSGSGYYKLPGGLIIQWVAVDLSSNADQSFSWPIQFPNALLGHANAIETGDASATSSWTLKMDGVNKAGGNVRARVTTNGGNTGIQAGSTLARLIAIGY